MGRALCYGYPRTTNDTHVHYSGKGHFMAAVLAAFPPDAEPPEDRWDFEPDPGETYHFDPTEDRKWDAFLLDEDEPGSWPEDFLRQFGG